jgi:two-component system response regulator GlrR
VDHLLRKICQQMKKEIKGLTPQAMQKLMLHDWPGNVRELENTIEYAVAMSPQDVVTEEYVFQTKPGAQEPFKPLKEAKDAFEKNYLIHLLQVCEGNVSKAAKLAGKYRADFYDLLKKHEVNPQEFKKNE